MAGYGLHDTGTVPPGRNFFQSSDGGSITASTIQISGSLLANPENIPFADVPGEPGNNNIAEKIAQLRSDKNFSDNMNVFEYYTNIIGTIGNMAKEAENGNKTSTLISEQLANQRESVIGVNLDEEAVNIIKFQKAFDASSRIVTVTNEILQTIINLGR